MTRGSECTGASCIHRNASCTRREALCVAAWLGASLVIGCGGDRSVTAPEAAPVPADAFEVVGTTVVIRLDKATALRTPDSALVIGELQLVVLRVGDADYRAFSNICTHAGCGIFIFTGGRLRCQCHGSEFDVNGTNVVGPATQPLPRYAVTLNSVTQELRVARG